MTSGTSGAPLARATLPVPPRPTTIARFGLALAAAPALAAAQTPAAPVAAVPPTIEACYVPMSGNVYRIDTPASPAAGAPRACLSATHVRFTWHQEGPAGPPGVAGAPGPKGDKGDPGTAAGVGLDLALTGALSVEKSGAVGGGLLARGAHPLAVPSGAGAHFMWVPQKYAVRAGRALGSEWDEGSIGEYSAAFGARAQTSGSGAFAAGGTVTASGANAVALGQNTVASGDASVALGRNASTNGKAGAFVSGDNSTAGQWTFMQARADNQFLVRAAGGTTLYSSHDLTAGVSLRPGGGAWETVSDVRRKTAFRDVDGEALLGRLAAVPMRSWQYRAQDASVRHLGPTAQDFRRAFALGESDTTITTVDADGVALAAAQALERRTRDLGAQLGLLRAENAALRDANAALRATNASLGATTAALRRDLGALWTEVALIRRSRVSGGQHAARAAARAVASSAAAR